MPVQMDQIAAYAMIIGFFLLFGLIFLTQVQSYTGEEQALPSLSPAAQEVEDELKRKSRRGRIYAALILAFFLLLGIFLLGAIWEEEHKERAPRSKSLQRDSMCEWREQESGR